MNNLDRNVGIGHNSKGLTLESFFIFDPQTQKATGRIKLTKEIIDNYLIRKEIKDKNGNLLSFERVIAYDSEVVGLRIVINKGGSKSWFFERNGKRYQIGSYKDFTVKKARDIALLLKEKIAIGEDPKINKLKIQNAKTLNDVAQQWIENCLKQSNKFTKSSVEKTKQRLKVWLFLNPCRASNTQKSKACRQTIMDNYKILNIKDKSITNITKDDLVLWHKTIGSQSEASANRVLDDVRSIFNYAEEIGEIKNNPCRFKNSERYTIEKRMKVIKPFNKTEWKRLIKSAIKVSKTHISFLPAMAILLLATIGRRKNEVLKCRWNQLKNEDSEILFTAKDVKNKTAITVPLINLAQNIISRLKEYQNRDELFIFPSKSKKGEIQPLQYINKTWKTILTNAGLEYKCIHMLRHTFACLLMEKFKDIKLVARIMGWKSLKVAEIYSEYKDETVKESIKEMNSFLKI